MARKPDQAMIERMMAAAEQLYGERGISAVSLREIGAAAGSRNNNAVQYHFGGVSELITAILRKRLPEVEEQRARMLAQLKAGGAEPCVRGLIDTLYRPLLTLADGDGNFAHARLHLAILNHPRDYLWSNPFQDQQPAAQEILSRIAALTPMPEAVYFERLRLVTLMVLNSLFNRPPPLDGAGLGAFLLESVLDMAAAALVAPLPKTALPGENLATVPSSVSSVRLSDEICDGIAVRGAGAGRYGEGVAIPPDCASENALTADRGKTSSATSERAR